MNGDEFRSVMFLLINNAQEAAKSAEEVIVVSCGNAGKITIDVIDKGPGMEHDFIDNGLFRPFRSTKSSGLGIGGYQISELLKSAGGHLEVISKKGLGTIMRVRIPAHDGAPSMNSAA